MPSGMLLASPIPRDLFSPVAGDAELGYFAGSNPVTSALEMLPSG
jgi:hypothetical protein